MGNQRTNSSVSKLFAREGILLSDAAGSHRTISYRQSMRAVNWVSDPRTDVSLVRCCISSAWSVTQESCYFRVAAPKGSLGGGAVGTTFGKFQVASKHKKKLFNVIAQSILRKAMWRPVQRGWE